MHIKEVIKSPLTYVYLCGNPYTQIDYIIHLHIVAYKGLVLKLPTIRPFKLTAKLDT